MDTYNQSWIVETKYAIETTGGEEGEQADID